MSQAIILWYRQNCRKDEYILPYAPLCIRAIPSGAPLLPQTTLTCRYARRSAAAMANANSTFLFERTILGCHHPAGCLYRSGR